MAESDRCPNCGGEMPANVPHGLCPGCLLRQGLESGGLSLSHPREPGVTAGWSEGIPHRSVLEVLKSSIGEVPSVLLRDTQTELESPVIRPSSPEMPDDTDRYQILGEIGRGGMGSIFKGRDPDLGRDLAIKVLLEKHHNDPEIARRFVEEAQIGGQLQHPGIVPVHELGQFGDRRLYFTMKLVKGRTLAALMAARDTPAHDLQRFLGIFEQVCQTMAYAHARGVIHRDLKPSNIMVGAFGEVQVMDWGLAKVLPQGDTADDRRPDEPAVSVIRTVRSGSDADASHSGVVLGTPAYMAPEQAGGDVAAIDERADVFGLGSILCEVLTGGPAYTGPSSAAILRKAIRGDTADALRRLDGCGAEVELVALARHCLAAEAGERPRDAGEVTRRLTAYLAGVQDRLKAAELARAAEEARAEEAQATAAAAERARAAEEARAEEARAGATAADGRARAERLARRMTMGLAASVLIAGALGAAGWRWVERDRMARTAAAALAVEKAVADAQLQHSLARISSAEDSPFWVKAAAAVKTADAVLARDEVDVATRQQAQVALRSIREEAHAAEAHAAEARADREMLGRIAEIRLQIADSFPARFDTETAYSAAFREYGIDVKALTAAEAGARIAARRPAAELVSVLDEWIFARRDVEGDLDGAQRLVEVASAADPDPWRTRVREALATQDLRDLQGLADVIDLNAVPAITAQRLGTGLCLMGDAERGVALLRQLQRRNPGDFWIARDLSTFLLRLESAPFAESLRFATVSVALRPTSAMAHAQLANVLERQGKREEAIGGYREALRLKPESALVHLYLGEFRLKAGKRDEAIGELLKAIRFVSKESWVDGSQKIRTQESLGKAILGAGEIGELVAAFRQAVVWSPEDPCLRHRLAVALLLADDREGYDRVAAQTVEMFSRKEDPFIAEAARACLLAPDSLADFSVPLHLAEAAVARQPTLPWWLYVLGLAHFRAGQSEKAITRLDESIGLAPLAGMPSR